MEWTFLRVKFWLISRADILIGTFILGNISKGSQKSFDIEIPSAFVSLINEKSIHLNYVTGIKATTSGELYQTDVVNSGRSADGALFKVTVSSLGETTIERIQISYSIINIQLSYFASGGGQFNYKSLQGSQYKKIHGSFSPIIYLIQGFDKLRLFKNVGFNLQFTFDEDFVFQTYTGNKFNELGVVYLTIGNQPVNVCSCDKYIQIDGCIDQCPQNAYPFVKYAKGGKTCLRCSAKLNQTINQFRTDCVCLQGLERVNEYCLPKAPIFECLAKNTILSNGACVCVAGTHSVSDNCQSVCSNNSYFDSPKGRCQCDFAYYNITGVCGVCSSDQIYNPTYQVCMCPQYQFLDQNKICKCIPNYNNFSGACIRTCPTGFVASQGNCVQAQQCSLNQIFQDGKCICTNGTYLVNGTCALCLATTYYNSSSQSCMNCLENCLTCFDFSTCGQCKNEFYYNSTSNQCVMNKTCKNNQTLNNGVCQCVPGTYIVNGTCSVCPQGTFYTSVLKTCQPCPKNCLVCINSTACIQCVSNYNFNEALAGCFPQCNANQTLLNEKCSCISGTYRVNDICTKCTAVQFYDQARQRCLPCLSNCLSCISAQSCDRCASVYFFNPTSKACELSNCPVNQTINDGKCTCIDGTYRIGSSCRVCKQNQFYSTKTEDCGNCSDNCVKCSNQATCSSCQPYYNLVNYQCKFNLYDLKSGYPQFSQNIIVTDFLSTQPSKNRKITPQEIRKIVKIQVNNKIFTPTQTLIKQNPKNINEIRIIHTFCGFVPFDNYNISYTFNDPKVSIREDIQIVKYNVLEKGFTNYLVQ